MKKSLYLFYGLLFVVCAAGQAFAQDDDPDAPSAEQDDMEGKIGIDRSEGHVDPHPAPPGVEDVEVGVHEQAGTGSDVAFAEAGVFEIGGSGSFQGNSDGLILTLSPQAGYFIVDNVEISGILNFAWANPDEGDSVTMFSLLAEPSFHLPFDDRLLGFIGLGAGPAYASEEFGFALKPRIGLDVLLGRSGIFRPALEMTWSTGDVVTTTGDTLVGVNVTYGISLGFHVML